MRTRRKSSKRPPFENRWTSGRKAWRWHQELEALGVEDARVRLALKDSLQPAPFPDPEIPVGFVRDWLRYHDRQSRRGMVRWTVTAALVAALATAAAIVGAWPVLARWL